MLHLSGLGEVVGRDEGITSLFQGGKQIQRLLEPVSHSGWWFLR
jgi:hypothetical protein